MLQLDLYTDYSLGNDIISYVNECLCQNGYCNMAISGGKTPARLFSYLENHHLMPFDKCCFYWVDERCVPYDSLDSNSGMALNNMPSIKKGRFYRMNGVIDPEKAAKQYENLLIENLPKSRNNMPLFDLILLGLGEDGHTASLFPEEFLGDDGGRIVLHQYVRKYNSHRLTLTPTVIREARKVVMLAVGKEAAIESLLAGNSVLGNVEVLLKH